jgi:hypothetical protein
MDAASAPTAGNTEHSSSTPGAATSRELARRLSLARELLERGRERQALEQLWRAKWLARRNADALRELLAATTSFKQQAGSHYATGSDHFAKTLQQDIAAAIRQPTAPAVTANKRVGLSNLLLGLFAGGFVGIVCGALVGGLIDDLTASPADILPGLAGSLIGALVGVVIGPVIGVVVASG